MRQPLCTKCGVPKRQRNGLCSQCNKLLFGRAVAIDDRDADDAEARAFGFEGEPLPEPHSGSGKQGKQGEEG